LDDLGAPFRVRASLSHETTLCIVALQCQNPEHRLRHAGSSRAARAALHVYTWPLRGPAGRAGGIACQGPPCTGSMSSLWWRGMRAVQTQRCQRLAMSWAAGGGAPLARPRAWTRNPCRRLARERARAVEPLTPQPPGSQGKEDSSCCACRQARRCGTGKCLAWRLLPLDTCAGAMHDPRQRMWSVRHRHAPHTGGGVDAAGARQL
jgi:hypothetical protein